ncbi:MAG TPA: VOC family protein [Kofleriaceae bacterium]|nr:VOC family protein [Kofleriaceae bacterium]
MIKGIHGLFYSTDPAATRDFFRDLVKLPGSDIGQGWWIFDLPEGDLGIHPVDEGQPGGGVHLSFYCDDIHGTVADLAKRGVQFTEAIADHGWGLVTQFMAPGGITVQLYEPRYVKPARVAAPKAAAPKAMARKAVPAKKKPARAVAAKRATAKKPAKKPAATAKRGGASSAKRTAKKGRY